MKASSQIPEDAADNDLPADVVAAWPRQLTAEERTHLRGAVAAYGAGEVIRAISSCGKSCTVLRVWRTLILEGYSRGEKPSPQVKAFWLALRAADDAAEDDGEDDDE